MPNPERGNKPNKTFILAFALVASLVALWGFGHRLHDTLVPVFGDVFQLHGLRLTLITNVYNFVYVVGALPAALYARRFGYKATILLGLGLVAVGAFTFYPAAETLAFRYYLIATICMAQGWLVLEVAANPLFAAWGSTERAVFRLNLAQCLFPLGALVGIFVANWLLEHNLALPQEAAAYAVAHPYIVLGACVLLLAFVFEETKFPSVAEIRIPGLNGIGREIKGLMAQPRMRTALAAQFFGIVAVGMDWSVTADAVRRGIPYLTFLQPHDTIVLFMSLFGIGRLIGTPLMLRIAPATVLLIFGLLGIVSAAIAAVPVSSFAVLGVLGLGIALSLTWPTILGLAIQGFGQEMKVATALLTIAGALGAVISQITLLAVGGLSNAAEMAIAALSIAVIVYYAWACGKPNASQTNRVVPRNNWFF
ncbi:MAG: MFS transporter [Rhizomicrobium sp.]|nr:MFS transporter [Rhizomicrobium sp.]